MKKNANLGLLLIRLALGAIFIVHGWLKISSLEGTGMFFEQLGIPAANVMAYVVAAVEFLGGIAMVLGVLTCWSGALIAIVMIVAIISAKFGRGFVGGWEFDLMLLASALGIALAGPGEWTIKRLFGKK